jgi:hypothetical protein
VSAWDEGGETAWEVERDQAVHDRLDARSRSVVVPGLAPALVRLERCGALGCGLRSDGSCGRGPDCAVGT